MRDISPVLASSCSSAADKNYKVNKLTQRHMTTKASTIVPIQVGDTTPTSISKVLCVEPKHTKFSHSSSSLVEYRSGSFSTKVAQHRVDSKKNQCICQWDDLGFSAQKCITEEKRYNMGVGEGKFGTRESTIPHYSFLLVVSYPLK